jgi:hypothetical protein
MLFKGFPFYGKVAFFNSAYARVKDKSELISILNENLLIKTEGVNEIERFLTSQLKTITLTLTSVDYLVNAVLTQFNVHINP